MDHDKSMKDYLGSGNGGGGGGYRDDLNGSRNSSSQSNIRSGRLGSSNSRNHSSSSANMNGPNRVRFPDDVGSNGEERMKPLAIIADIFTAILCLVCSVGLGIVLVVFYVTVRPFSLSAYRRITAQTGAASFIDALTLLLPNIRIHLTGDSDVPSSVGTSILVSNHLVDADWLVVLMLCRCVGLRGSAKVFLRNEYLQISSNGVANNASNSNSNNSNSFSASSRPSYNSFSGGPTNTSPVNMSGKTSSFGLLNDGSSCTALANINNSYSNSVNGLHRAHIESPKDLAILAKLLHLFLDYPLMNEEDYNVSDREQLFSLLRSFAAGNGNGEVVPCHLLFFPEGWSLHNGADRLSILAKSNAFAKREGRPQLKHLLLPRTRGFNASLECLRESSPVVYDITMAYSGYDGALPLSAKLNIMSLWNIVRHKLPRNIHIRIKRYSMEEVMQDASWLDKKWAEKDRLLNHFSRHQSFPTDSRGFCRHRIFNTRQYSLETSLVALGRLLLIPCAFPFLLLLSFPLFWTMMVIWMTMQVYRYFFPDPAASTQNDASGGSIGGQQTPGSASAAGTPFFPVTPFASPSIFNWRDMFTHRDSTTG